jgi:hypothetical protein
MELEFDTLSVSCPYCGALPGRECKKIKGLEFVTLHHHRFEKARREAVERRRKETGTTETKET